MTQIITKDNRVVCKTTVPYPPQIIRDMKKAGYKIQETTLSKKEESNDENNIICGK